MFFDIKINDDLLEIPNKEPKLTRQKAFANLSEYLKNNQMENIPLLNIEVNINDYDINNVPQIKKYNSESNQMTISPIIKRIKTF